MLELSHKKLEVWKLSMEVTKEVYKLTATFPKEELFNLTSQMRRASVSVVSNLSEGASRISKERPTLSWGCGPSNAAARKVLRSMDRNHYR